MDHGTGQPKFLFVPVSGPGGAGEYFRSLAVARALERRWPGCAIRFIVSRDAPYACDIPYPVRLVDRSPTYETRVVIDTIERERPDVVIFDSSGRVAQYGRAKELGARVVFVSSRATTRRKGFRLRRMRRMDQHWIAQPRILGGDLRAGERLRLRLVPGCGVEFLEVLHDPVDESGTRDLQQQLGVESGGYVLVCPGGGGVFNDRRDATQVFYEAGCRLARDAGLPVVAVLGARFVPKEPQPAGVHLLQTLPNAQLMGLLRDARVAVINGGSLLLQALAQRTPCVAAPIAEDQPARIEACARRGYCRATTLDAPSLVRGALDLLESHGERAALRDRLAALNLRNGVDVAVEAIARLLPASSTAARRWQGASGATAPHHAGDPVERLRRVRARGCGGLQRALRSGTTSC